MTIPIKSGTASTKKATQNIGANIYKLVVRNLKTGTASVEDTSSDTYKKADQTFQFADGKTEKAAVVIELSSAKKKDPKRQAQEMDILAVDVGILDEAASKKIGFVHRHIAAIEKELKEEIVKHKVRYELAHINSKPPPSDTVQLVPKSFRFVTYVKDKTDKDTKDETPPALSLLIQTSDKDNGEKAGVQRKWGTLWNDTNKCSPIPKGHTASIIFKKLMIYGKMIAPALKSQSYDSELVSSQGDLQVLVKTGIKKHRERECTVNPIAGGLGTETRTVSEINVTLDPLRLILNQVSRYIQIPD